MNLKSLVVVVLRLFVIYFIITSVMQVMYIFSSLNVQLSGSNIGAIVAYVAAALVIVVTLWFLAGPVASFTTRNLDQEFSLGKLSLSDCYSIAFVMLGLYFSITGLPRCLYWLYDSFVTAARDSGRGPVDKIDYYNGFRSIFTIVLGSVFVIKGRALALKLASAHEKQIQDTAIKNESDVVCSD